MSEAIVICIIGNLVTLIGTVATDLATSTKNKVDRAVQDEMMKARLSSVEKKLDIHNGYAEKLGDIQKDIAVIRTEIINLKEAR